MLKPECYYPTEKANLLIRLVDVELELGEAYTQRHMAMVEWQRARHHSYSMTTEQSEAAKKRVADTNTYYLQEAVEDLDTQIIVLQEERDLIRFLIGHTGG
jgi:hypothetical protein